MISQNRQKKIDVFLKKTYEWLQYNNFPPSEIEQLVYRNLTTMGINDDREVTGMFVKWIYEFRFKNSINVFVSPNHKYFCQFVDNNSLRNIDDEIDPIKIYVSLDYNHLHEGVNQIFEFLRINGIEHNSKVAKKIRTDNVVLRIPNKEDAYKVMDFINNNQYLLEGHNEVNPFCFKKGICGLAVDNVHSYNTEVSNLISEYLMECIMKKQIPSYEGFVPFVDNYRYKFASDKVEYQRLNEIKNLISLSLKSENIQEFNNHYYNVIGNSTLKNNKAKKSEDINLITDVLCLAMNKTAEKHDKKFAISGVLQYLETGIVNGISRFNINGKLSRDLLMEFDYKKVKENLMNYYKTQNLVKILNEVFNKKNKNKANKPNEMTFLIHAINLTYQKYGYEQVRVGLYNYLYNKTSQNFTGEENRQKLMSFNIDELRDQINKVYSKGNNIETIDSFLEQNLKLQKQNSYKSH